MKCQCGVNTSKVQKDRDGLLRPVCKRCERPAVNQSKVGTINMAIPEPEITDNDKEDEKLSKDRKNKKLFDNDK